mmetsp:Transcript_9165/g.20542  ORF Transcript_9165/g.20542 Transcript_9165/m.20542 type:complete len:701 (+) Transcript_9165:243-2345(+)
MEDSTSTKKGDEDRDGADTERASTEDQSAQVECPDNCEANIGIEALLGQIKMSDDEFETMKANQRKQMLRNLIVNAFLVFLGLTFLTTMDSNEEVSNIGAICVFMLYPRLCIFDGLRELFKHMYLRGQPVPHTMRQYIYLHDYYNSSLWDNALAGSIPFFFMFIFRQNPPDLIWNAQFWIMDGIMLISWSMLRSMSAVHHVSSQYCEHALALDEGRPPNKDANWEIETAFQSQVYPILGFALYIIADVLLPNDGETTTVSWIIYALIFNYGRIQYRAMFISSLRKESGEDAISFPTTSEILKADRPSFLLMEQIWFSVVHGVVGTPLLQLLQTNHFNPDGVYWVVVKSVLLGLWCGVYLRFSMASAQRVVAKVQFKYVATKNKLPEGELPTTASKGDDADEAQQTWPAVTTSNGGDGERQQRFNGSAVTPPTTGSCTGTGRSLVWRCVIATCCILVVGASFLAYTIYSGLAPIEMNRPSLTTDPGQPLYIISSINLQHPFEDMGAMSQYEADVIQDEAFLNTFLPFSRVAAKRIYGNETNINFVHGMFYYERETYPIRDDGCFTGLDRIWMRSGFIVGVSNDNEAQMIAQDMSERHPHPHRFDGGKWTAKRLPTNTPINQEHLPHSEGGLVSAAIQVNGDMFWQGLRDCVGYLRDDVVPEKPRNFSMILYAKHIIGWQGAYEFDGVYLDRILFGNRLSSL